MCVESRRPPNEVKLFLRQEACFGCCRCGSALIEYHHIIPWAEDQHFRPEDMMALCPNCHTAIVHFPREEQYKIKNNPFNKTQGFPNGTLVGFADEIRILSGDQEFQHPHKIVMLAVDDEALLTFALEENRVVVSGQLYDEHNNLLLKIENNEWKDAQKLNWDIESRANFLKIREAKKRINFSLEIKGGSCQINADLWYKNMQFKLVNGKLYVNGRSIFTINLSTRGAAGVFHYRTSDGVCSFVLSERFLDMTLAQTSASDA